MIYPDVLSMPITFDDFNQPEVVRESTSNNPYPNENQIYEQSTSRLSTAGTGVWNSDGKDWSHCTADTKDEALGQNGLHTGSIDVVS